MGTLTIAFLMGLAGSLHCAGMCGPIIWVMPFQSLGGMKKWFGILLYHVGRISTYALLGFILFSFRELFHPEIQQYVSVALGLVMLVAGLLSFFPTGRLRVSLPWSFQVSKALTYFMTKPGAGTLFFTGALNGLLPCGLVYMALAAAISVKGSTASSTISFMYAFGLGTAPMLVLLTILKRRISILQATTIRKWIPVVTIFLGALFVIRGLNLGIPYLSPKVQVTQQSVKASCCHKE